MTDYINRRDGYVVDGRFRVGLKNAVRVTPRTVYLAAKAHLRAGDEIPLQYFVGTAERESGFAVNARAIEANGFITDGIYQISERERDDVAPGRRLLELEDATEVMVRLARRNRDFILRTVRHTVGSKTPAKLADVTPYLSIAHNQGLGAVAKTIERHGLDWAAYKARNAKHPDGPRWIRYGETVLSGGSRWGEAIAL